ncbi:7481bafc-d46d-42e5-9043-71c16cf29dd7-CDS [Sclerotinia trifoliorum]|uniref:7481bafc-d46d-42e5-9043-71c16cf29dd7-CDS n=1 Tax=Sclerotinia trifoliorum TaxID=28548 RepID=A0A8H2VRZ0_9HELO|nr:7481bafc-d46d-42e5-9043-71c16cf29dd7-CDS [Sclerotinia trifoliorum]
MKPATTRKTALILVDVQNAFLHPTAFGDLTKRSTPKCEENIEILLKQAREFNEKLPAASISSSVLICHVQHHSINPNSLLHPIKQIEIDGKSVPAVQPQKFAAPRFNERVWIKNVNSAFVGMGLENFLRNNDVRQLIICGLTTDHCISTSTRTANNLRIVDIVKNGALVDEGDIVLVGDACATFARGGIDAETIHQVNLVSLDEEFAQVRETLNVIKTVFVKF